MDPKPPPSSAEEPVPDKPLDSDCCGQGCQPCVFDIYEQNLRIWQTRQIQGGNSELATRMSSDNFTSCSLVSIDALTDSTFLYTFSLPPGQYLRSNPGQHLILNALSHDKHSVSRQYSIYHVKDDCTAFSVIIKLYSEGVVSRIISQWSFGIQCRWRGPMGDFVHTPLKFSKLFLLGMGTGIVPLLSVIRSILNDEMDETFLHLVCGFRQMTDVFPLDELKVFSAFWNFKLTLCLSRDKTAPSFRPGQIICDQRIDLDLIKSPKLNLPDDLV
ncbi:NADH-cytochrome b5 reductase-like [Tigriopus californicus]|uniref:NADH-cytochrome b5 reductase-like n=1 Tax=Tigriopus californicus TaxID=6832 RepID=UPI0027DA3654|nr:NADH-cytochrome b5 reductase-like [Tigriopus californicus]|eukprot:TCALIF_00365-PA protein Name:"Similar to Cyb5rl NADH-cytochrome b5 reductase-like (Mus musculus)" AED:0.31 eAED:0.34 QI:0/-1/0/1/-1/1/1/0/271